MIGRTAVELGFNSQTTRQANVDELHSMGLIHDLEHVLTTKRGERVRCRLTAEIVARNGENVILTTLRPNAEPGPSEIRLKGELEMGQQHAAGTTVRFWLPRMEAAA